MYREAEAFTDAHAPRAFTHKGPDEGVSLTKISLTNVVRSIIIVYSYVLDAT